MMEENLDHSNNIKPSGFAFAIDRGGTFTDIFCELPDGQQIVRKLLSEDPNNYDDVSESIYMHSRVKHFVVVRISVIR